MQQTISTQIKITYLNNAIACALFVIALRVFFLQVTLHTKLIDKSKKNYLRTERIIPLRGNILDRNGILLVTNRPVVNLYWVGTGKRKLTAEQHSLIQTLNEILKTDFYEDKHLFIAERRYQQYCLHQDLSIETLSKLEECLPQSPNLLIKNDFERWYPHHNFASHLLGYLGTCNEDTIGKMGLEKLCDINLKGQSGTLLKIINSYGRSLNETLLTPPQSGNSIMTTLDSNIQKIIEEVFPEEVSGTFIILNPQDGGIIALTSRPSFDPCMFLNTISPNDWQTFNDIQQPFINRALNAQYPPGSIFKLITSSAGLERNVITRETSIFCGGYTTFADRQYWCHYHAGHGHLSASQALEHSCNIMFYDIGKRISIDTLADYAHRFGLGKKTNIALQEQTGLVPSSQWKKKVKKEPWWPGETLSAAIGQSFLLVTPIQVARMIGGIFTHKLVKPRMLMNEPIESEPVMVQPDTLEFLRQSMKKVVTTGTGRNVSKVKDIEIYAKTSTAQTSALHKRTLGTKYLEHGWFVGYFKYKKEEPLVLVILLENVGSSSVATAVAKRFFVEYKQYVDSSAYPATNLS